MKFRYSKAGGINMYFLLRRSGLSDTSSTNSKRLDRWRVGYILVLNNGIGGTTGSNKGVFFNIKLRSREVPGTPGGGV